MNKIFTIMISTILLFIGALLVIPWFINWNDYKDDILAKISDSTGYEIKIKGNLSAGFLPSPHININDIFMSSGDAEISHNFEINVDQASVSVGFLPLLSGNINIHSIRLNKPVIHLKENEIKNTKDIVEKKKTEKQDKALSNQPSVKIDSLYIEDAMVGLYQKEKDPLIITLPKFEFSADDLKGPYWFNGQIKSGNIDVVTTGEIGSFATKEPTSVILGLKGQGYSFDYSGVFDYNAEYVNAQGEISFVVKSMKHLAERFGVEAQGLKDDKFQLTGLLSGSSKGLKLTDGKINLGNVEEAALLKFDLNRQDGKGAIELQNIPGEGMIVLDIEAGDTNAIKVKGGMAIQSLDSLLVDSLGVMNSEDFENPNIPKSIETDFSLSFDDKSVKFATQELKLSDYNLKTVLVNYNTDTQDIFMATKDFLGASIKLNSSSDNKIFDLEFSHPNLQNFMKAFDGKAALAPVMDNKIFFKGRFSNNENDILQAQNFALTLGRMKIDGDLSIDISNKNSVTADLNVNTLDIRDILGHSKNSKPVSVSGDENQDKKTSLWSRDAIDTSFLRMANIDLKAKAKEVLYTPWNVNNAELSLLLKDGSLEIQELSGNVFSGRTSLQGQISAKSDDKPIEIDMGIEATDIDLSSLVKAMTSQSEDRVTGQGDLSLKLVTQGVSSSALIYGLNADGSLKTSDLIVKGIDLAKVTEAIDDESLSDAAAVIRGGFQQGQTAFKPVDYPIVIREGTMPVKDFILESQTAKLTSNGEVSFARWVMDVNNVVDFIEPYDLPSVEMTIKGPLNAPSQNVAGDLLQSFLKNKYGKKVEKLIGDKLGRDSPAGAIINNILGLDPNQNSQGSNDNTQQQPQQEQPKLQDQLIRGLFDKLGQ